MTTTNRRSDRNERIARRIPEELATEGNLDLVEELYAEDAVEHDPFGDHSGRAAIREIMACILAAFPDFSATVEDVIADGDILAAFPDFSATVEDVIADGDTVAMRVMLRGSHEGEFMGVEPTGREFEVGNMVFTRLDDGKIAERWVQPDTLGLLRQLGIESPAAESR
jgi:steroid delta-isomerase-like uncharacterized protein